jgi:hypothetical protein
MLHDKMLMKNVEYSCCVLVDGGRNACMQFACKPFNVAQTAIKGSYICYAKFFATKAQFSSPRILQNFSHSPSHRIFGRMHEALNINKK